MDQNIHQKFSGHLCSKCGGLAPGWKCPACGAIATAFDSSHALNCPVKGRMEAQCQKCGQAESKCTCVV